MSCPACGEALSRGQDRCPACGAAPAPRTEGSLAPDLDLMIGEPARGKPGRLVEVPGFKRREPSWRDEVRERVRHRKRQPQSEALPLFRDPAEEAPGEPPAAAGEDPGPPPAGDDAVEDLMLSERDTPNAGLLEDPPVADLPMRAFADAEPEGEPAEAGPRLLDLSDQEFAAAAVEPEPFAAAEPATPVERPALPVERVQAAALDLLTLGCAGSLVVYFAARAARVPLSGLLPTWPYLAGFLALFALVYAAFFTGLTGQTLGKMAFGLRVVDRGGEPPGHARAALRAVLGAAGTLLLVGLAPIFVDPARRALHDRLVKTRVIRV